MKQKLILFVSFLFWGIGVAFSQIKVTGIVVDEQDEPVIGATIQIKGDKSKGTITDIDGKFKISAPQNAQLVVSFVGMQSEEVKVAPTMKITLHASSEMLEEVVVTGMVATDKRLFTGAADKLSASDVKIDGMADISRGLEGRSAGVSIQNISGTFGTAPKIRVRGATSIYGNSKPLWVVDGVIQDNVVDVGADDLSSGDAVTLISSAIAGLNPDDIESFQILKDGSATSIYGAKAMAGVIVITTKKGRQGNSSFSYTGEFTTRLKPNYRTFNIMTTHGGGNIVNVASISGLTADANGTLYGASKAGVINLTKYIATQMGKKNIRCNAVAPGLVLTPAALDNLNEEVRNIFLGQCATPYLGEPEDVAATIAFLASNDARYITGQTIVVDGGLTIHNPTVELS